MVRLFGKSETEAAKRVKRLMWILLGVAAFLYAGASAALAVFQSRETAFLFGFFNILLSVIFWSGVLFFFSIKFRLTRRFVKMLNDFETGVIDESAGVFTGYDDALTQKDGVEFYAMTLDQPSPKRGDIVLRKVLIEKTRPKPQIAAGEKILIRTHANILVEYELLNRSGDKK